jgi:predicted dehydrogenase
MPKPVAPSAARKVNVAVVGLGFMGTTHLKAYQQIESARISAVCDAMRLPVNGVLPGISGNITGHDALHLGSEVRAYGSLDEVLADPGVELVDLCVPTPLHHPQAIAALRAGKHVICEKPLARTAVLAREIVDVAKSAKGFFLPAMCLRFWPEWAWLKHTVDRNTFGKVLAARFRRVSEAPGWSRGSYFKGDESGGALLDLHIHDTDFIQYLFGRPLSVFASGLTRFSGAIDHVVAQYQVASGATVSAEGSWLMTAGHGFSMAYTVNFERATADYDSVRGAEALRVFEEGQPPRVIKCEGPDGYGQELRHMIESILAGTRPTVVTAQDGLSAVEICEAAEESVKTGQVVSLHCGSCK